MNKPKIIGTGLSGLVGTRIAELLSNEYNFIDLSLKTGVNIVDYKNLQNAFDQNKDAIAVLHLAAFTDTNAAWEQRGDKTGLCYKLNVNGTQNILDLCQKTGKYLIEISTDFVFDGKKDGFYTEEDTPNPIEWYGETKYLAEKVIVDSGYKAAVARISFPYRAEFDEKKDLVRKVIDGFQSGKLYPMFADQITTTTFIDDIALGIGKFLKLQPQGVFHLVGSSAQSPYDMCLAIADVFGFDRSLVQKGSLTDYLNTLPVGSRPWQKNLALSNEKVSKLGVSMKNLQDGLRTMREQLEK